MTATETHIVKRGRPPGRKTSPQRGDMQYSKTSVTNGSDLLPGITDKRSFVYRRFKDVVRALLVDQAGAENCSEARLQLIRRFAATAVIAEQMEARLANGEAIDIGEHSTLASILVRLAARIGLERRTKEANGSLLQQYLGEKPEIIADEA